MTQPHNLYNKFGKLLFKIFCHTRKASRAVKASKKNKFPVRNFIIHYSFSPELWLYIRETLTRLSIYAARLDIMVEWTWKLGNAGTLYCLDLITSSQCHKMSQGQAYSFESTQDLCCYYDNIYLIRNVRVNITIGKSLASRSVF